MGVRERRPARPGGLRAFLAAVAAVLAVLLPLSHHAPAAPAAPAETAKTGVVTAGGGGRLPAGSGDAVCGDVRFDRTKLPGRTVTVANGDWPTAAAADLLRLYGWPRAVPFDVARWTVVLSNAGVLVTFLPARVPLPADPPRPPGGGWSVGPPCAPLRPQRTGPRTVAARAVGERSAQRAAEAPSSIRQ